MSASSHFLLAFFNASFSWLKHTQLLLPKYRRFILPLVLALLWLQPTTRDMLINVLSDAFWQVSVFVAATLVVYHLFSHKLQRLYRSDTGNAHQLREVTVASLFGVIPGCGGAIIVITQYVSGTMSFGSVVAVLTATMGDAAFLLLAAEPATGLLVLSVCFAVGIGSGLVVNLLHGENFLRGNVSAKVTSVEVSGVNASSVKVCGAIPNGAIPNGAIPNGAMASGDVGASEINSISSCGHGTCSPALPTKSEAENAVIPKRLKVQSFLWQWLMIPATVIGLAIAAQVDVAATLAIDDSVLIYLGAILTFAFICLWAATREINSFESIVAEDIKSHKNKALQKVALDTNFITSWVVVAFVSFELLMLYVDLDLKSFVAGLGSYTPLVAVFIGMIPGCGPQILTTSLYLAGALPLSAQLANAISNDGDALFPAIAISPKVALVATLYSSVPALLVAYSYLWLFE